MSKKHNHSSPKRRQWFFRAMKDIAVIIRWIVEFALLAFELWEKFTK